jgi:hypothetical protein
MDSITDFVRNFNELSSMYIAAYYNMSIAIEYYFILKTNSGVSILAIMMLLLLTSYSLVVVVLASVDSTVTSLAQAKKKMPTTAATTSSSSSSHHHRTASTTTTPNIGTSNTEVSPQNNDDEDNSNYQPSFPPSTLSLSPSSERPSDVPAPSPEEQQATVQRLYAASAIAASDNNGDSTDNNNFISQIDQQQTQQQQQQQQQSCLDSSYIDRFILPFKEARFTHLRPCVTVTGTVISGQKINADGDISFNMVVDPPYEGMLGPGNLDPSHATSSGEHGIHVEVICQEPVISSQRMDAGHAMDIMDLTFILHYQQTMNMS